MLDVLMTEDEAASALLAFVFSGALGSPKGRGVGYALMETTPTTFSWSAALADIDGPPVPIDRYLVRIDRRSKAISPPELIKLTETELAEVILLATGQHLASSSRFTDGALSISYLAKVQENADVAYVVQLRHHGNVASMDALMMLISKTVDTRILPVPRVYPIPGERSRQKATGMGRQITQLIQGTVASAVYPSLPHDEKLVFVGKMACAFQACWSIQLPEPRLIGELIVGADPDDGGKDEPGTTPRLGDSTYFSIGPDRHYNLGGPFSSVREYLQAHIKSTLIALEKQQGIEEYKEQYLERIRDFVHNRMDVYKIPSIVEDTPVVAIHSDMGPHNVIISDHTPINIHAIIDWEFVASAPFLSQYRIIEMLFRKPAPNGFGPEYEGAAELRQAFWDAIPKWKKLWSESESTQVFLEWFKFGLFLKPEWRPKDLEEDQAQEYWRENIRVVEGLLQKYV
ncbi:hypothetical protein B0T17DRAFT_519523 [Bombardia bombarda]|uniref:Aminoglycoside phosphotransferase domain-containing protein n=1 Tax=Bombardia bombarda TaxID=252184 RepID=A0AA39XM74_9PEZI|nr:hypothetical protein B0T17DRAFT_519523 [Bombardia bombarda]